MARSTASAKPVWSSAARPGPRSLADFEICIAYCAGRDLVALPVADEVLIPYDIQTNRAHCAMLRRRKIISSERLAAIARGLDRIERAWLRGEFHLDPALEDVHINIERAVAAIGGEEAAAVMHTARSRNDQCATDMRLWVRDQLLRLTESAAGLLNEIAAFAERNATTVAAGWTHGQPAMPTSLGHWACAHGFAVARDLQALVDLWPLVNVSPLGAAAGFGSSWPIDRKLTASLLGFDAPQTNSLDAVTTRWECEARVGFALATFMTHLSSLAQDLIHLSSPPLRLIRLDPAFTTGSSIMPQKRNPDFAEVTRARAASIQSLLGSLLGVGRGALSGYNRDSQWTKYWIMDLVEGVGSAPEVFGRAMATLQVDREGLERGAREDFICAVDLADHLASTRGVGFRRLYHLIGEAVERDREAGAFRLETIDRIMKREKIEPPLERKELENITDPSRAIERRRADGGPRPADARAQARQLKSAAARASRTTQTRRRALERARARLNETIDRTIDSK
jgi:argininosuccinate lyase